MLAHYKHVERYKKKRGITYDSFLNKKIKKKIIKTNGTKTERTKNNFTK